MRQDVQQNKQQKEEAVDPVGDVDDRASMVQRLCTGIDKQLHALNENLSNSESTLITTLSSTTTTAIQQSLKDAPVDKLQQEMSQCKLLLARKQRHFEELRRSSQKEQKEQADAFRSVQTQFSWLSKQLEKERNKLAKVSASLKAEGIKGTGVSCNLQAERAKVAELSASLRAERAMCTELSDALREEQNKCSDISRDLTAERRKNTKTWDGISIPSGAT
ncbi:hypothetical protein CGCSCA1_v004978 [Colletotrichum siamense]|nr:hypothetical protein CGCSCA1_v004978 [Colletotrichum siamense]